MTTEPPIDLDKLRHTVQKFGVHSFTTHQVVSDYHHGARWSEEAAEHVAQALHQHATVLGIRNASPSSDALGSVWIAM